MAEYYRNAWYAQLQKKVAELEEEIEKAVELPTVTSADEGKVLTVDSEGKWDAEDVPKELPTVTDADEGKVVTVDSQGKYVVEQPTKELPTVTSADEGKVLTVDSNGDWGAKDVPKELPTVTSADEGKVLAVNSNGEWDAITPSGGSSMDFSTASEVEVGVWTNNKKIYRQIFTWSGYTGGGTTEHIMGTISDLSEVLPMSTITFRDTDNRFYIPDYSAQAYAAANGVKVETNGNVVFRNQGNNFNNGKIDAVIYYTKTTD